MRELREQAYFTVLALPGVKHDEVLLEPSQVRTELSKPITHAAIANAVASSGKYQLLGFAGETRFGQQDEGNGNQLTKNLYPWIGIVACFVGVVLSIEHSFASFSLHRAMRSFMAGSFLVFSFLKLFDLREFSDAYQMYDLIARAIPAWGKVYPFAELSLGVAYLVGWRLPLTHIATSILMIIGAVGVFRALRQKRAIRCACLGTVLNLPMTAVTLVEVLSITGLACTMLLIDLKSAQ